MRHRALLSNYNYLTFNLLHWFKAYNLIAFFKLSSQEIVHLMRAIFFCNVCVETRMCRLFSIKWERRRPNTTVLRHQTFRRRRWKTFFPVDWSRKSLSISPLQLVNCPSRWSLYQSYITLALGADHHSNRETGTAMYYLATELHDLSVPCQPWFSEFIATTHIFRDLSPYRPCQELNI